MLLVPVTVALKASCWPVVTEAVAGLIATVITEPPVTVTVVVAVVVPTSFWAVNV